MGLVGLLLGWSVWSGLVLAGPLTERVATFPAWNGKPPVLAVQGDLHYPTWMVGTWTVESRLVDLSAPLAPAVVTPGFEGNRSQLNQPISFQVRFLPQRQLLQSQSGFQAPAPILKLPSAAPDPVVADRAFNGLNLARAYLGDGAVQSVTVDPRSPNRQVTLLGGDRQLISIVSGRTTEQPDDQHFLATEVFQQVFRGAGHPYLNQVETTTAYERLSANGPVLADQFTAIYLSPQDAAYFKAGDRPVALYHYRLTLTPIRETAASAASN